MVNIPVYMIDSDQRQIGVHSLNRHPLTSLSQIMLRIKGILKSVSYPHSQIYGRFIG